MNAIDSVLYCRCTLPLQGYAIGNLFSRYCCVEKQSTGDEVRELYCPLRVSCRFCELHCLKNCLLTKSEILVHFVMGRGEGAPVIHTSSETESLFESKMLAPSKPRDGSTGENELRKEKKKLKEEKDKTDSKDSRRRRESSGRDKRREEKNSSEKKSKSDRPSKSKRKRDEPSENDIGDVKSQEFDDESHSAKKLRVEHSASLLEDDIEDTSFRKTSITSNGNEVDSFGMSEPTVKLLKEKGFTNLFDIQVATYNILRNERKDVIGRARTGSGKTLAFVLPIIETLNAEKLTRVPVQNKPLVLCLAPTRELAQQVHRDFEAFGGAHRMTSSCFYGGSAKGPQKGDLRRGLDILVGTPGRIIDHLDEGNLRLSHVRFVVLDEADEMLSLGFSDAIERILSECTAVSGKQMLLFSATIPRWVKDIARKYMSPDAVTVDTVSDDKNRTNSDITHLAIACPPKERGDTLVDVVKIYAGSFGKTILFCDTKAECNEVAGHEKLVNSLGGVAVLHGDIPQGQRDQTLQSYRESKVRVLVATDVAARGLDIDGVDLVLQTHPPSDYEKYVHRSGRTGRAGKTGVCVLFYSQRERYLVGLIEHKAGIKFKRANPPQPADIVRASVADNVKKITSVHKDNLALFRGVARQVVDNFGKDKNGAEEALAASLAFISGYGPERFKSRSLMSCFEGFTAVVLSAASPFRSSGQVWSTLRRCVAPTIVASLNGMKICKDMNKAVFDVPDEHVDEVMRSELPDSMKLQIPSDEIPELNEDDFDLTAATAQLNERRQFYRQKRGGGGGGGGGGNRWGGSSNSFGGGRSFNRGSSFGGSGGHGGSGNFRRSSAPAWTRG